MSRRIPVRSAGIHLYVASACPFCHRVIAALELTGLSGKVSYTWMQNVKDAAGWAIDPDAEPVFHADRLSAVYEGLDPETAQRPAVPLLVDLVARSILSTRSTEMTRYFSTGMNGTYKVSVDLYPAHLAAEIDSLNDWLHDNINRAVYLAGFSGDQADYEAKVYHIFRSLDEIENRLRKQTYLLGKAITESDLYLFATLVRFDEIYFPLFKCSYRLIKDYPALSEYLNGLLAIAELRRTVHIESFKEHYYKSVMHSGEHPLNLNPIGTVPVSMFKQ